MFLYHPPPPSLSPSATPSSTPPLSPFSRGCPHPFPYYQLSSLLLTGAAEMKLSAFVSYACYLWFERRVRSRTFIEWNLARVYGVIFVSIRFFPFLSLRAVSLERSFTDWLALSFSSPIECWTGGGRACARSFFFNVRFRRVLVDIFLPAFISVVVLGRVTHIETRETRLSVGRVLLAQLLDGIVSPDGFSCLVVVGASFAFRVVCS